MEKLKWYLVLLSSAFQIELIASYNRKEEVHIFVEDAEKSKGSKVCKFGNNHVFCDYSTPDGEKYSSVTLFSGTSDNITIKGAPAIKFDDDLCCFREIHLLNTKSITINKGGLNRTAKQYRLILKNSEGKLINDEAIKYLKSENSTIADLELEQTTEFDIDTSKIEKFTATTKSLSSSIIKSSIKKLSLTIAAESNLRIIDTIIDSVEELIFRNTKESLIFNTDIKIIQPNGITIEDGSIVTAANVVFGKLAHESIILKGTLTLKDITYSKGYPLDWLVLMPGGSLTISKITGGKDSKLQSYTITNVDFIFRPFEVIDVRERIWLPITLGILLGIAILGICFMLVWLCAFSKKKLPLMNISITKKIDKQEFIKLEKERNPAMHNVKNLYMTGNEEIPTQSKSNPAEDHSDPESQQDYVDLDQNELENYTELEEKITNIEMKNSVSKATIDKKTSYDDKTAKPNIALKLPATLPPQKIMLKPPVPKRDWPPPSESGPIKANKSFLQNINHKQIQAPPPPSQTFAATLGNVHHSSNRMPKLPPIKKMSEADELHDSQEEYDVCEDSDG